MGEVDLTEEGLNRVSAEVARLRLTNAKLASEVERLEKLIAHLHKKFYALDEKNARLSKILADHPETGGCYRAFPRLRAENVRLRKVLDKLARLGAEPEYGNSIGNEIARAALREAGKENSSAA